MPGPKIERAVAEQLADLSDELAGSLESGDSCAASQSAARFRAGVTQAIADGKVPDVYLEDLSGLANELELQAPECVEPPPLSDEDDEDDDGKDKKKKKKGKKDKGNDDEGDATPTVSLPVEPDTVTTITATTDTTLTEPSTTEEDR